MKPASLTLRPSQEEDGIYLKNWLTDPEVLNWFPMEGEKEIDDSVRIWVEHAKKGTGFTALWDGKPCGMVVFYLQTFQKLAHTCLFSIIVDKEYRGKGIGKILIEEMITLAKNTYHIEILHLEVYEGNPARRLYEKMGFTPFGAHDCFTKEHGKCRRKVFMEKYLIDKGMMHGRA